MKLLPTYRAYFFTNFYLSDIQKGIQPLHVVGDMAALYVDDSEKRDMFLEWAGKDKVAIVLNGGNCAALDEIYTQLSGCDYPLAKFEEDYESLNCATTCVGVILPDSIWDNGRHNENFLGNVMNIFHRDNTLTPQNQWLVDNLHRYRLA